MNRIILHQSILKTASFSFAHSGGPGGQNINKVNTKVFLSLRIDTLQGLSDVDQTLIIQKLAHRIDNQGYLTISVEEERSQYRNKEIALQKIETLIINATIQQKKRIPTSPGKGAKIKTLKFKKLKSQVKRNRKSPLVDE